MSDFENRKDLVFDHLHFRSRLEDALATKGAKPDPLRLRKPPPISGKPPWFAEYYVTHSQRERDRKLFAR